MISPCTFPFQRNNLIRKNIFACLFGVHNTIILSRHEQVCLMRLRFERYFSHHRAMDYVHSDDQFARKTAIPQDKFLDLVNLVLTTTWHTFNSQFYQQTDGVAMGGPASSTTAEIYMQAHESTAISTALHPPKVWERSVDDVYSIVKRTQLENFFHHINNLHQNIKFTMEEESNGELAFLDTLLKRNNGEISVLVYRKCCFLLV